MCRWNYETLSNNFALAYNKKEEGDITLATAERKKKKSDPDNVIALVWHQQSAGLWNGALAGRIKNINSLPERYWTGYAEIFEEKGAGELISLSYL